MISLFGALALTSAAPRLAMPDHVCNAACVGWLAANGVRLALIFWRDRVFGSPRAVPEFGKKPDHDGSLLD